MTLAWINQQSDRRSRVLFQENFNKILEDQRPLLEVQILPISEVRLTKTIGIWNIVVQEKEFSTTIQQGK